MSSGGIVGSGASLQARAEKCEVRIPRVIFLALEGEQTTMMEGQEQDEGARVSYSCLLVCAANLLWLVLGSQ